MKLIYPVSRYILLSLNCLLLFLSVFADKLELPGLLQIAGRFHPLALHLPIGLLLITLLIYLFRKSFSKEPSEIISFLLHAGALTAVFSALLGIFLSRETVYDERLLGNHLWAGVAVSILSALLAFLYSPEQNSLVIKTMMLVLLPALIFGSHYGASLTHGEDYLDFTGEIKKTPKVITDSSAIYDAVVEPILQTRCYSCHSEKKAKGKLIMTTMTKLMEGGKNGKVIVPGDPLNSHIIQRLALDVDDKKHMPPRGKPQLTEQEITLLSEWIKNGADSLTRFADLLPTDSFRIFAASFIPRAENAKEYSFPAASATTVDKLQSPYLTIQPLAIGSPALRADFFIREGFSSARIKELEKISQQVVSLNLSNMPVKDEDLGMISRLINLEYLNLNGSLINGKGLNTLKACRKLSVVSISGTPVNNAGLQVLADMNNIKRIFCWNTTATPAEIITLRKKYSQISWEDGYIPDTTERLQLTPPILVNSDKTLLTLEDSIVFKHPMPGVTIRYTIDGKDPDSLQSPIYSKSFGIHESTRVKAIAVRTGWNTSIVSDYTLFFRGTQPSAARLLTKTDKEYSANGISTLTDGQKGETSNFKSFWLGTRENHLDAKFYFNQPAAIKEIVISAGRNIGAFVMPPKKIDIWGGKDSLHLKLIATIIPEQPKKYEPDRIEAHRAKINGLYGCIRLVVYPVKKLPLWHSGKGEKAWIFLDEVFFN